MLSQSPIHVSAPLRIGSSHRIRAFQRPQHQEVHIDPHLPSPVILAGPEIGVISRQRPQTELRPQLRPISTVSPPARDPRSHRGVSPIVGLPAPEAPAPTEEVPHTPRAFQPTKLPPSPRHLRKTPRFRPSNCPIVRAAISLFAPILAPLRHRRRRCRQGRSTRHKRSLARRAGPRALPAGIR